MTLGERIAALRGERKLSQGELADQLQVSRQSVSKWESAMSIPDLDKILLMSEIFEVSTDFLLKDEMVEEVYVPGNPEAVVGKEAIRKVSMEEAQEFMKVRIETRGRIAFGVAACILSPVLLLLLCGMAEFGLIGISEDMAAGIGIVTLLLMVAGAVANFIILGMKLEK